MAPVDNSQRELSFLGPRMFFLVKHIASFDCAEVPRGEICDSQKADPVLVLVELGRFCQLVFVLVEGGAEDSIPHQPEN